MGNLSGGKMLRKRQRAAFGVTLSEFFREAEEGEAPESRQAECLRLFGQLPRETQELALSLLRELSKGDGKS